MTIFGSQKERPGGLCHALKVAESRRLIAVQVAVLVAMREAETRKRCGTAPNPRRPHGLA
jgi:hypothetical protein